jgi:uncharacterized membrane protein
MSLLILKYRSYIMAKTLSFATIHFGVAFTVGYALTGSVAVGSAIALVEPACNTVAYFFHEKIWNKIEHGEPLGLAGIIGGKPHPS